jgi:N4-gp56 family major capsid protein
MSVAVAGGYNGGVDAYAGVFIPEIWSGKLQVKFYKATVFGEIANTDYEGEIKGQGDKVQIRSTSRHHDLDVHEGSGAVGSDPEPTKQTLNIDQAKYFNVVVDDVDAVQSDVSMMETFTNDASEQMKVSIDSTVLAGVFAGADATNKGSTAGAVSGNIDLGATGAAISLTKSNVLDYIVDCGLVLDENNIPETGRWMVVPAWMAALIKKSDLKDAALTGDSQTPLRNGRLGMIDRFTLYVSNQVPTSADSGTKYHVLFGTKAAITFASQFTKMETLRSTATFGNIVRGLNVFGYKVVQGKALGDLYCIKG